MMTLRAKQIRAARKGFTIVELLVAVLILAVGVLSLASTSGVVLQQMNGANTQTHGSYIAASRFEDLSGRKCMGLDGTGSTTSRGVTETWTVTAAENSTMVASVTIVMQGRTTPELYKTVISCF